MIEPVITAGGLIIAAAVAAIGSIMVAKIASVGRKVSRVGVTAAAALTAADDAATFAAPTGDGYANRTEQSLQRLERAMNTVQSDLGGIREEIRTERRDRLHLAESFNQHIEKSKP